ncbi:MAG: type I glyceraldehyde-3-phosphate dehydrogenase [Gemmataceae bacterium]|nr:type I glyceraldehyde-3-phosphate dehydrogenase [Gemmataceae bacterium]
MAVKRIGINGFGRIGRLVLRTIKARHAGTIEVGAINDLFPASTNAHLLKYDSTYGPFGAEVLAVKEPVLKDGKMVEPGEIKVDGQSIRVTAERNPAEIKWSEMGVDVVIESTGLFTDGAKARAHIDGGKAKKVIISAPAKDKETPTFVLGCNGSKYDPAKHHVISNASCTTNGLAPLVRVLKDAFGIDKGLLTTVHAYTNTQKLQDLGASDLRDARAAAQNIVPSETGAARAVYKVIDGLEGKFGGMAFRVPTATVSVVDFTVLLERPATKEAIRDAMAAYAEGKCLVGGKYVKDESDSMVGILGVCDEPLVSSDLRGTSYSSVFSACDTLVVGNLAKIIAWYDNEWGYACRLGDLAAKVASLL